MAQSRRWCFTLNHPTRDEQDRLTADAPAGLKYMIVGAEVGAEGTPHLQGYLIMAKMTRMVALKRWLPRAHLEVARGTTSDNVKYCSKETLLIEVGDQPEDTGAKGKQLLHENVKELAKAGKFEEIPAWILIKSYLSLRAIHKDFSKLPPDADGETGQWYTGPSGSGKSRTARQNYPGAYLKMASKWWDGFQNEDAVILDDLDKGHAGLAHHLKIWGDRYAFPGEIKCGVLKIRPKHIIITSQYTIDEIWEDAETREALHRRFHTTHFRSL